MSGIKKWIILLGTVFTLGMGFQSISVVANAQVVNPTSSDQDEAYNYFRKTLGKKLYKKYSAIHQNLNGQYLFHGLMTSATKFDVGYYNKYSKIRNYFGTPRYLYKFNSITIDDDIDSTPWVTGDDGGYLLQNIYDDRDIYYRMNATGETADIYNAAIAAWNQLGVVQLVRTKSYDPSVIQFDPAVDNLDNGRADGVTTYEYDDNGNFINTSIQINTEVLDEDNYRQLAVAEHEIGHSLGFDHENRHWGKRTSLMNGVADDQTYGTDFYEDYKKQNLVGAKEQGKLIQMYNLDVMKGYYEYPDVDADTLD